MNIAYLYGKEIQNVLIISTSVLVYGNNVLNYFNFFAQKNSVKTCKIQAIFVNYLSFMNLEGSTFNPFQNMKDIYNIYGYLKKQKNHNATDKINKIICKELLTFKQALNKTFKVRPKPK